MVYIAFFCSANEKERNVSIKYTNMEPKNCVIDNDVKEELTTNQIIFKAQVNF